MAATRLFVSLYPALASCVFCYSSSLVKAHSMRLRLKFLKSCHNEQVLSRSLVPIRLTRLNNHPFDDFSYNIVSKHIDITKCTEKDAFKKLRVAKYNFNNSVVADWRDAILDDIYNTLRRKLRALEGTLNRKLKSLINNSPWTTNSNASGVVNLSSKNISNDTKIAVSYGMTFSISSKPPPLQLA